MNSSRTAMWCGLVALISQRSLFHRRTALCGELSVPYSHVTVGHRCDFGRENKPQQAPGQPQPQPAAVSEAASSLSAMLAWDGDARAGGGWRTATTDRKAYLRGEGLCAARGNGREQRGGRGGIHRRNAAHSPLSVGGARGAAPGGSRRCCRRKCVTAQPVLHLGNKRALAPPGHSARGGGAPRRCERVL